MLVPERSQGVMRGGCLGAVVLGGIGFLLGFVGPMILTPDANQGPMLGIFITGPAGAVLGAIGGAIAAAMRKPKPLR
jgi:hypothetical protein